MAHNVELIHDEDIIEIEEDVTKLEPQIDQNEEAASIDYSNLNLEVSTLPVTEDYYLRVLHKGRCSKKLDAKLQSQISPKPNYTTTAELKLRPKYRPIRPKPYIYTTKPYISNVTSRNKLVGPSVWNVNSSERLIVQTSLLKKDNIRNVTELNNSNSKISNYIKPINDNTGNVAVTTKENIIENSNGAGVKKDSRKSSSKASNKSSIELFFESMAQTVLNFPMEVQAEIKMEICKLVTMAEIKYCGSQMKQKTN